MLYQKWKTGLLATGEVFSLCNQLNIDTLLSKVLINRGVKNQQEAKQKYLSDIPLSDPFLIKDMDRAVNRILSAVDNGEKIVIYGDYDVDGVCATATLFCYLDSLGADVYYKLPNRETDGYGLNSDVLKKLKDRGVDLVITVDNGISAINEIEYANSIGLDVVITDHHITKGKLPPALAVVDPQRTDDFSDCKNLAGVGVAFKLVCALEGAPCEEMLEFYGDFVCVGTIADLMTIENENRTMVKYGLNMLNTSPRTGFNALIEASGHSGKTLTSESVAFTIAPRINAAGRMSDATKALELLLCDDDDEAKELAQYLEDENRKRQEAQNKIADDIMGEIADNDSLVCDNVIIVKGEDFHPGVIGIVASKMVEKYAKPTIVFTRNGDEYKGSGRSVPTFNLHKALENCKDYLIRFGGHELAAGLAIDGENITPFTKRINYFAKQDSKMSAAPELVIDAKINLSEINEQSVKQLDLLSPYGNGNEMPLFMSEKCTVKAIYPVNDGKHVRVKIEQNGATIQGILFNVSPEEFAYSAGDIVSVCYYLSIFVSNNGEMVSVRFKDFKPYEFSDDMIDSYDVYRMFKNSFELKDECKSYLMPTRNEVATIYRRITTGKVNCEDLRPLFIKFRQINSGKIQIIIDTLLDLGLIQSVRTATACKFEKVDVSDKKDLMSSSVLQKLL